MEPSLILDIITVTAVILGIIFGLVQLRHYHLSRKREADLFLLNSFQTEEFFHGFWLIQELGSGLNKTQIEERLGEEARHVFSVMSTWERLGILVFNREVSIELVNSAYGSSIRFSWERLETYVSGLREDRQDETLFEWFQWLAERLADREKSGAPVPAYLAYQDWE